MEIDLTCGERMGGSGIEAMEFDPYLYGIPSMLDGELRWWMLQVESL